MRGIKWTMRDKERHGVVFNRAFRTPRMTLFKIIIVVIYDVYNNNYIVNPRYDVQEDNFMQVMTTMGSNMNKKTWCTAISHERDERNIPASRHIGRAREPLPNERGRKAQLELRNTLCLNELRIFRAEAIRKSKCEIK